MENIDITTNINGIQLSSCIMNASGAICRTDIELSNLLNSSSGAIVTKSCTKHPRKGNSYPRYFEWNIGSINSMGLPNYGIDFYLDFLERKKITKPVLISIAGRSIDEISFIIQKSNFCSKISALEINLSCPNLIENKNQGIVGYDFCVVSHFLEKIFRFHEKPIGLKLPPYFRDIHIENMSLILNKFPISFITCINSIPNGIFIDVNKESTVIRPNKGFGGIGGSIIKPFALANVFKFYSFLRKEISIIGCGGIQSGKDMFEYILCGASAVQIGTQLIKEGISVFDRLNQEFSSLLRKKKYSSIDDFKGKLQNIL
ncbi:dihydroorotate oxidase [Blattabacterium cuenoti]|uniref:dihydroorotate oxidase n=1 Tax=Blattabacterium cuenoti TaxID=1653831 RepID=UPI00163BD919|nr:dihydroorotate oxidase [Blattabacterium cuenoti]